ncbi:MAG: methyltransferase [Anaerolineae bacterium]|nr:methyltransferase [Anaerolineae bacterium]
MQIQHERTSWLTVKQEALPDGLATIARMPGVSDLGPAHTALFAAVRTIPPDRVAVLGPGSVPTALWAARSGATVRHFVDSIAEAASLSATLSRNGLASIPGHPDWQAAASAAETCDLALLHLPRGRELQQQLLQLAGALLRPGGRLIFVGAKNEGIKSAVRYATRIYGRAGVVSRKGGHHAAMAYRPAAAISPPQVVFTSNPIVVDGAQTELVACAGVFAPDRLDDGAAALITGMQIVPGTRVLDLGCGTGLVALAAARQGGKVIAADVSARAVASAQRTLAANGNPSVAVHLCCGAAAVDDATVDTVVTNPPFHKGHDVSFEVSELFVRESARVLRPGGSVYLVANIHVDYGHRLRQHFGNVGTAYQNNRFRVWHATKH